jgi:hypothetical protein
MINSACSEPAGGCSRAGPLPSRSPAWLQKLPRSSRTSSALAAACTFTAIAAPDGYVVTASSGGQRVSLACVNSPRP